MTDIHELLRIASDGDTAVSAGEDLNRARGQLIRRRRARTKALTGGIGGLAAFVALGVVVASADSPSESPSISAGPAADRIHLVSADVTEGSFSFAKVPDGWEVQRATRSSVVIAPAGKPNGIRMTPDPADVASGKAKPDGVQGTNSFEGKLVIVFDEYPIDGTRSTVDGRTYATRAESAYTTISVDTLPGQPDGVIRVQYPTKTGWSQSTLREFLGSVTVNGSAQPSV